MALQQFAHAAGRVEQAWEEWGRVRKRLGLAPHVGTADDPPTRDMFEQVAHQISTWLKEQLRRVARRPPGWPSDLRPAVEDES
jgi:hypothetical protein